MFQGVLWSRAQHLEPGAASSAPQGASHPLRSRTNRGDIITSVPHPSCLFLPYTSLQQKVPNHNAPGYAEGKGTIVTKVLLSGHHTSQHISSSHKGSGSGQLWIYSAHSGHVEAPVDLMCQCPQRGAYLPQRERMDPHRCQSQPEPGLVQPRAQVSPKLPRWLEQADGITCSHGRSRSQACRQGWEELQQLPVPP